MADMRVSIVVGLVDRLTAPMRAMVGQFQAMGSRLANVGRQIGVVGGALAAISFLAPMQAAAAFDGQLRDIAITSGRSGKDVESFIATTAKSYEALALKVGQTSENLAKGAQVLIAAGMAEPLIEKIMPTIGRVATAANASMEDTSKTAFALANTLKIAPEQMELAMAKLVTAGKLGRFEFKNMASEFPELTSQVAKLGVTGMEAVNFLGAALQTAMLGTDSPDKAANNLKNFLTKIAAPEAIKNFKEEMGVDVVKLMANATAKGINPVEAVIQKMSDKLKVPQKEIDKIMRETGQKGVKGPEAEAEVRRRIEQLISGTKVGKIFADMQVLDFLIPMLLNKEQFKRFKQEIAAAGVDVIAKDFESRMRGLSQQMLFFSNVATQVGRRVGLAFASNLPAANQALTRLLHWVSETDKAFPGLIDKTLTIGGALLAFGAAIAILTPVFGALAATLGILIHPIVLLALAFAGAAALIWSRWGDFASKFAAVWEGVKEAASGAVQFLTSLFSGDLKGMAAGLGRIMDGLGAAARAGWDIVKAIFEGALAEIDALLGTNLAATWQSVKQGASDALEGVKQKASEFLDWAKSLPEQLMGALGAMWDDIRQKGADAWEGAKQKASEFLDWARSLPDQLMGALGDLASRMAAKGAEIVQGLWTGMQDKFAEFIGWVQSIPGRIIAAIGSIDLSGIIKWPSMPSWLGGGGAPKPGAGNAPAPSTMEGFNPTSAPERPLPSSGGVQRAEVGGRITVAAAEGARIVNVESVNAAVPIEPNRGAMLGRA